MKVELTEGEFKLVQQEREKAKVEAERIEKFRKMVEPYLGILKLLPNENFICLDCGNVEVFWWAFHGTAAVKFIQKNHGTKSREMTGKFADLDVDEWYERTCGECTSTNVYMKEHIMDILPEQEVKQ